MFKRQTAEEAEAKQQARLAEAAARALGKAPTHRRVALSLRPPSMMPDECNYMASIEYDD
jgi:hypothetical protein